MSLSVKGSIKQKLELEQGTSKAGKEWKSQSFVVNTGAQYNPDVCFKLFGEEKIQMLESVNDGDEVEVAFNLSSRVGVWTHFVATYDGRGGATANQGCFFSIDGIPMSVTQAFTGANYVAMENTTSEPAIGTANANAATTFFSEGKMSDCRVYDKVLSSQEITDLSQKTDVQSGLVGHWMTDIDSVEDQSSNSLGGSDIVSLATSTNVPPLPSNPVFGNRYLLLDGSDFFTIEQDSAMQSIFQSSHTFAFWVRFLDGTPSSTQMMFAAQSPNGPNVTRVAFFMG